MPNFFRYLSEYVWLVALCISAFNYRRARRAILASTGAGRVREAESYMRRFAIGANLPWVVMGLGQISGYTPTVWYYFRPQDGNPFVITWFAITFLTACVYAWWVLLAGGAEKVRDLNLMAVFGRRGNNLRSLAAIKLLAASAILLMPVWVYLVVSANVQLPP